MDTQTWDLCLDSNLNIAICQAPYCDAQDAACHLRLFQGELYYDTKQGMPYWQSILGGWPSPPVLRAYMVAQAVLATGVETAKAYITSWQDRQIAGAVVVTDAYNQTSVAGFSVTPAAATI